MTEYEIQPVALRCAQTGRELRAGETYFSVLRDTGQGYARSDFSAEAWAGPPEDAIAFWKSKVPKTPDTPQRIDDDVVWEFFDQLAGKEEPAKQNFRYILALLLLRRKILKFTNVRREQDREILVLRRVATDAEHRVVDPGLTESQIADLQAEVNHILQTPVGLIAR